VIWKNTRTVSYLAVFVLKIFALFKHCLRFYLKQKCLTSKKTILEIIEQMRKSQTKTAIKTAVLVALFFSRESPEKIQVGA